MADNQIRGTESQDCPSIRVTQSDNCPSIRVRLTGGGGTKAVDPLDVNFYDYDGTCVAAYTAADFAALDAMPGNPSHQGLTAQGWNWSLSDAKAYVAANKWLDIGQQYITDDGKTRLYLNISSEGRTSVPLNFSQTAANGVTVDWGDGSATETAAGTGNQTITHTYAAPGNYVVTLKVTNGTATLGGSTNVPTIGVNGNAGRVYSNMLIKAEVGADMGLAQAFNYSFSIETVTLPKSVTAIPNNCFNNASSLLFLSIPPGATIGSSFSSCASLAGVSLPKDATLTTSAFGSCTSIRSLTPPPVVTIPSSVLSCVYGSLARLSVPEGTETIDSQAFGGCYCCATLYLPSSLKTIGTQAFNNCTGLGEIHCKATVPPTIASNSFNNMQSDCKIYVPTASVAAYQGASNWQNYSSQIVGE